MQLAVGDFRLGSFCLFVLEICCYLFSLRLARPQQNCISIFAELSMVSNRVVYTICIYRHIVLAASAQSTTMDSGESARSAFFFLYSKNFFADCKKKNAKLVHFEMSWRLGCCGIAFAQYKLNEREFKWNILWQRKNIVNISDASSELAHSRDRRWESFFYLICHIYTMFFVC